MGQLLADHGKPLSSAPDPAPGFASTYGFGLLYERPPVLDPETLVARLATSSITIERVSEPVAARDYAAALEQTWSWPEAEEALARCTYKLRVSDVGVAELAYRVRYSAVSAAVLRVAEMTNPTVCHWEPAGCLVEPKRLTRDLQWPFNVRLADIDRGREFLMDTLGLAALGLIDAQCQYRGLDHAEMARWMYGVGRTLFAEGGVTADGDSIPGLHPGEIWTCRRQTAMFLPARPVVSIDPPARHSGRQNVVVIVP